MDIFEIKQEKTVSREEVARRLRLLADMLARNNDLEFDRGGCISPFESPTASAQGRARGGDR
jgi:hypothetical protein